MLSIDSVVHSYSGGSQIQYPNWGVEKGNHSMILGGSGSGKTTLLHLVGGLLKPNTGSIKIEGTDIVQMKSKALDRFRGANIGIVFQKPHLLSSLSILENLLLSQYLSKKTVARAEALNILDQLDISELKSRKIHQISEGQAQRVSIARALLNRPKLLLADEPTASLDDVNCERVISLLKGQAEASSSTLVVATHDQRVKSEFQNTLEL